MSWRVWEWRSGSTAFDFSSRWEWGDSVPRPVKRAAGTCSVGELVSLRSSLYIVEKRKCLASWQKLSSRSSVAQTIAWLVYQLSFLGSVIKLCSFNMKWNALLLAVEEAECCHPVGYRACSPYVSRRFGIIYYLHHLINSIELSTTLVATRF
jgi:hypothetical protein